MYSHFLYLDEKEITSDDTLIKLNTKEVLVEAT
jgi:hypothetical protein